MNFLPDIWPQYNWGDSSWDPDQSPWHPKETRRTGAQGWCWGSGEHRFFRVRRPGGREGEKVLWGTLQEEPQVVLGTIGEYHHYSIYYLACNNYFFIASVLEVNVVGVIICTITNPVLLLSLRNRQWVYQGVIFVGRLVRIWRSRKENKYCVSVIQFPIQYTSFYCLLKEFNGCGAAPVLEK